MPQAIVVRQSLSLPVAPAHETEMKIIFVFFVWLFVCLSHTPGIGVFHQPLCTPPNGYPSCYELPSHYTYTLCQPIIWCWYYEFHSLFLRNVCHILCHAQIRCHRTQYQRFVKPILVIS